MRVLLCAFCIFFQTLAAHAAITPQELRDMAYAGDIDGVEQALRQAHQETLDGTLTFEELRELNNILIVSHPDVLDFVEDWMEAYPDSPYAKTLHVFHTRDIAWAIRTIAVARRVSPEVMQTFRAMQDQGMDLALSAYAMAPDYVPASDAVLLHNFTTKRLSPSEHLDILTAVMEATPNRGSLARASILASRKWGGPGYSALIGLCDQYAAKVTDIENYTPEVCSIDLIHYYPPTDQGRAYSYDLLEDHDHPYLAKARAQRGLDRGLPEDADDVIAYLSHPDVLDNEMIRLFRERFAPTEKVESLIALYDQQKRQFVEEGLLHNPYDPEVLFRAFDYYDVRVTMQGTTIPDNAEEMREFGYLLTRRYVAASPYSGGAWQRMANAIPDSFQSEQNLRRQAITYDPIRVNAVYYGGHDDGSLYGYLQSKLAIFRKLRALEEEGRPNPFSEAEELDHVLCPLVRLDRLHRARCEADGLNDQSCYLWAPSIQADIRQSVTAIERQGVCRYERTAPLTDLLYTEPMPFDLGELNEGIANR